MHIFLQTDRLALRRFTEADEEALFDLDSDPDVMRFLNGGMPTPRDIAQTVILPRATDEFLGWFSFVLSETNPTDISLGFRFRRTGWGKGYATEGSRALIRKAFTELDVQRVVATTYEHNLASRRVLEKLGMRIVRRFRLTQRDVARATTHQPASLEPWEGDELEYCIEMGEWERQQRVMRIGGSQSGR